MHVKHPTRDFLYSVTDVLVANLAVADFLFTAFCPIWAVERYKQGQWIIVRVELIFKFIILKLSQY